MSRLIAGKSISSGTGRGLSSTTLITICALRNPGSRAMKKMIRNAAALPTTSDRSEIQGCASQNDTANHAAANAVAMKNFVRTERYTRLFECEKVTVFAAVGAVCTFIHAFDFIRNIPDLSYGTMLREGHELRRYSGGKRCQKSVKLQSRPRLRGRRLQEPSPSSCSRRLVECNVHVAGSPSHQLLLDPCVLLVIAIPGRIAVRAHSCTLNAK